MRRLLASRKIVKSESIVNICSIPVCSAAHTRDASAKSMGRSAYFFIKSCPPPNKTWRNAELLIPCGCVRS